MPSPAKPPSVRPLKPAKDGQTSKTAAAKKKPSSARISAACEACKKRKTKCTGGPSPCQLCETLGTECVIDLSLDMRRRAAFQRTIDESRSYQDALNALLDGIREGPSPRLESLFDYVRSGATNQEIASAVQPYLSRNEDTDGDETMLSQADGIGPFLEDFKPVKSPAEVSSLASAASESGRGKLGDLQHMPISTLLLSLKNCSLSQGEALLRRFLVLKTGDKIDAPPSWSDGKSPLESRGPETSPPSIAERAMWHPVLHIRSQSSCLEERPQFAHFEPLARRFSEGGPHSNHSQPPVSDSSSPASAMSRRSSRHPMINTDVSLSALTVASSPATPYFELITDFPPGQPRQNEWDLSVAQDDQVTRLRVPRHLVLPLVVPDDSPMSRTYTDYLFGARRMLEGGVPAGDVLGHTDRVTVDLFFRPRRTNDKFDCASWACEVSRSYDNDVFVRLATACLLTHMMRWLLVPTLENYQRVPDMMKPTPSQCMIPHIGAIETIPIPPVRDATIHKLRDWLTPLIEARWSVNWPYPVDVAVERDPLTGGTVLTQKFHDHVTMYDNWSVGSRFLSAFPEVAGRIRIHEEG